MIISNNTLLIGKVLHELDSIASTNQYALELLSKDTLGEGTVILTQNQYAGRGQVNKKWESEPKKNLTLSIILYPTFLPAQKQFLLNQAISLGVLEAIQVFIPRGVSIKWPNDLYVGDKKITGILIQNSLKGSLLQSSVIGIGLNVNQTNFKSDAPNPTSISLEIQKETDLQAVFNELCQRIEHRYLQLKAGHHEQLKEDYHQYLYRLGTIHLYKRPDDTLFKGMIKGVTERGALIMLRGENEVVFDLKEIRFVID